MKKILALILSVAMLATLMVGCSTTSGKLDSIKKSGKMVVYTNPEFPPFEYMDEGNSIKGVDVDIAEAIAKKLGVKLEMKSAEFDGIVSSISSGKGDMAVSGITINDERKKEVDFSSPYINSVQYLILHDDSDIETTEDLKGKKIGAPEGYTGFFVIDDAINKDDGFLKDSGSTLTNYKNGTLASEDLKNGKVDAVVIDELPAKRIAEKNEGLKAIKLVYKDGSDVSEEYGVAIAKGNEDLLEIINEVIKDLKENGKIDESVIAHS